jgi:hypothetical protein
VRLYDDVRAPRVVGEGREGWSVTESGRKWSDSQNWVFGILGSIIAGGALFWATVGGGPLTPKPTPAPAARAVVSIAAFQLPFFVKSTENEQVPITVANSGDAIAERCVITGDVGIGNPEFSVPAHASVTVNWTLRTYKVSGQATFTVRVVCANGSSPSVSKQTMGL